MPDEQAVDQRGPNHSNDNHEAEIGFDRPGAFHRPGNQPSSIRMWRMNEPNKGTRRKFRSNKCGRVSPTGESIHPVISCSSVRRLSFAFRWGSNKMKRSGPSSTSAITCCCVPCRLTRWAQAGFLRQSHEGTCRLTAITESGLDRLLGSGAQERPMEVRSSFVRDRRTQVITKGDGAAARRRAGLSDDPLGLGGEPSASAHRSGAQ